MTQFTLDSSNAIIESQLNEKVRILEDYSNADALTCIGPIMSGMDNLIRGAVEHIKQRQTKRRKLLLILETSGGQIEVAERIANTLRHHYRNVEYIVPSHAMSAGTVLVMSGDAIHMDYYSVLGPIDPQFERPGDRQLLPALGYLIQYERLVEKSRKGDLTTVEASYLLTKFDPAEMYSHEQARDLSITLLREWLVKYKFRNWKKTKTKGQPVTMDYKRKRAEKIGNQLNDTNLWHSHGRGISMDVLRKKLDLIIEDFGKDPDFNSRIKSYQNLLKDYMAKLGHVFVVHGCDKYSGL